MVSEREAKIYQQDMELRQRYMGRRHLMSKNETQLEIHLADNRNMGMLLDDGQHYYMGSSRNRQCCRRWSDNDAS